MTDDIHGENEWEEVFVTYDSLEAEMIKDLLESGDIIVAMRSSKSTPYPLNVGKMGEIRILVRREDREAAVKVIKGEADNHAAS